MIDEVREKEISNKKWRIWAHFAGQIVENVLVGNFWPESLSGMAFALIKAREEGVPCI
jgi:hypothetical protein